jgi:N-acetylglutamate synthase-like GNAT family acetyltransferase
MEVLKAKTKDVKKIIEIISMLNTENYNFSEKNKIEEFIKKGLCYVVKDNQDIVGATTLNIEEGACEIYALATNKKVAGTLLIKEVITFCKENKLPKLWCWSLSNYKTKGFYNKMGFKEQFLLKKQCYGEDCYFFGMLIKN